MWTEASLLDAVEAHIEQSQGAYLLRQVRMRERVIDGLLVHGARRVAIEAKTNRADFLRESDDKRRPTERASHACVYLAPPGTIHSEFTPPGWGLWEAVAPGRIVVRKDPRWRTPQPEAVDLLATDLVERAAGHERRSRAPGSPSALRQDVERLQGLVASRDAAVARERARAQDAAEQVAALVGEQVCSTCESPIVYTRVGAWRHVDRSWDGMCEARRAELERRRRKALTGAEYVTVPAPRIVPAGVSTDH